MGFHELPEPPNLLMFNDTIPVIDDSFDRLFIDHPLYNLNPQTFCLEIERVVKEFKIPYLQAVAFLCLKYELDYTAIPKLLTPTMKEKCDLDAQERNLFRKSKCPMPTKPTRLT